MWYRIFADGSEVDVIYANSPNEATDIAWRRHGDARYTYQLY